MGSGRRETVAACDTLTGGLLESLAGLEVIELAGLNDDGHASGQLRGVEVDCFVELDWHGPDRWEVYQGRHHLRTPITHLYELILTYF